MAVAVAVLGAAVAGDAQAEPGIGAVAARIGSGLFTNPGLLAVDQSSGTVFATDYGSSPGSSPGSVLAFDATGGRLPQLDLDGSNDPQAGEFVLPVGVAVDNSGGPSQGDIYVTEYGHNLVYKFNATGDLLAQWDGGATPAGSFSLPSGVAVDAHGAVFVVDQQHHAIDVFSPSGAYVSQIVDPEHLTTPFGIAVGGAGQVFVNNYASDVVEYDAAGTFVRVLDARGSTAVTVDPVSGSIYVDNGSFIAQYDSAGTLVRDSAPFAAGGSVGIAVDGRTHTVYAADTAARAVDVLPVVATPDVSTGAASDVTATSTRVSGTVDPNGVASRYHVEYGTDTTYALGVAPSPDGDAGSGRDPLEVGADLAGLTPATTYHYRLVTDSADGRDYGSDRTFTTDPLPTVVLTGRAAQVTTTTATLTGAIDPMGLETGYHFEYGTDTTYGSRVPVADAAVGADRRSTAIRQTIAGLTAGVTYHYRLVGTVGGFPVYGSNRVFTARPPTGYRYLPAQDRRIVYEGTWGPSPSAMTTVNSGSRIRFGFSGRAVTGVFNVAHITNPAQIYVSIDGGAPTLYSADSPTIDFTPQPLAMGPHRVEIAVKDVDQNANRWSPPLQSGLTVTGFEIGAGTALPAPRTIPPRIAFYGDSITEGIRVLGLDTSPTASDGTRTYAYLTARAFGAEARQVGFGGQGILTGGSGDVPPAPQTFGWNYATSRADPTFVPQVVVINQGTNDVGASPPTFTAAYAQYLAEIRRAYPDAWILAMAPFCGCHAGDVRAAVTVAGDPRTVYVDTAGWVPVEHTTDGLHPNVLGHQLAATKLTAEIRRVTNGSWK